MAIKNLFKALLLTLLLGALNTPATSQSNERLRQQLIVPDSTQIQILTTKDGSVLKGRIEHIGENEVRFATAVATLTIPISSIKSVKTRDIPIGRRVGREDWFPNPNATRLFFAPNGRMLKKGQGYFSDYYLFFPGVAFGISDQFTMGGGMSLIPGVGLDNQVFYLTPKLGLHASPKANVAVGVLFIVLPNVADANSAGVLYSVSTFGSEDQSLTAGIGFGFAGGEFSEKPMIVLGFESRISRRVAFVSENWILPGVDQPLASAGLRFMGESLSVDLALATPIGEDFIFPGFPVIDFVFNF